MSTVHAPTVAHFSQDAPDWWNPGGKFKPLHALNPVRLDFILGELRQRFTPAAPKGLRVLDVGCGGGLLCEPMARLGAKIMGLDADPVAIDVAHAHAVGSELKIDYHNGAVENLKAEKFDAILALEIIEHVENPTDFIAALRQRLRPNGLLLLSTLNRTTKSYLGAILAAEKILGWMTPGTHDWGKFITPAEMATILRDCGFDSNPPRGIGFNPLTRQWRLQADTGINYILSARAA